MQCVGCKREFCFACGDVLEGVLATETTASGRVPKHEGLHIEDMPDEILMHIMEAEVAKPVPPLPVLRQDILSVLPERFAEAERRAVFLFNIKRTTFGDAGDMARVANDWTLWRHVWMALPQPMRIPLRTTSGYQSAVIESIRSGREAMKVWPRILANQPRRFSDVPSVISSTSNPLYFLLLPDDINNQNWPVAKLDVSYTKLVAVPADIGRLTALQELNLQFNRLRVLPPEIGQLTKLRKLNLQSNLLYALPAEIGQLTMLQELLLHDNHLQALPTEIWRLTALQLLYINANWLQVIPPEIGRLTALQKLNLNANRLQVIPPEIGQLTALQKLNLNANRLQVIPPEIGRLTALQELIIGYNHLQSLPTDIGRLTTLNILDLQSNQLWPMAEQTVNAIETLRRAGVKVQL